MFKGVLKLIKLRRSLFPSKFFVFSSDIKRNQPNELKISPENKKEDSTSLKSEESIPKAISKNSISNENNTYIFAQYLPLDWSEKDLKKYMDPEDQYLKKIQLVRNRLGVYSGKAVFEFVSAEICKKFTEKFHENFIETTESFKRIVFKPFSLKKNKEKLQIIPGIKQVYVYNVDSSATPDDIYDLASEFGEITKVQFPVHESTKKHKGFGLITFKTADAAQKFLKFIDGKEFFGKTLRLLFQIF